jgi:hypothetical protein
VEALLLTSVVLVLIGAGLVLLGRGWPSSSRLGGFRSWVRRGTMDDPSLAEERGEAVREDDDAHWHWDDRTRDGDG